MGEISEKHILFQYIRKSVCLTEPFTLKDCPKKKKNLFALARSKTFQILFLFECSMIQSSLPLSHELLVKPSAAYLLTRYSFCHILAPVMQYVLFFDITQLLHAHSHRCKVVLNYKTKPTLMNNQLLLASKYPGWLCVI